MFLFMYTATDCWSGWVQRQQSCYHLNEARDKTALKNWPDARDYCISQGGHLLQLETREELDFIIDRFMQKVSNIQSRLGFSDIYVWTALNDIVQGLYLIFCVYSHRQSMCARW